MDHQGILVVVSGFSGAGKGTLMKELLKQYDNYALSVSATTRQPREGEKDGEDYFFVTKEHFQQMIEENRLVEYAQYVNHYYGTPRDYVEKKMAEGKDVIPVQRNCAAVWLDAARRPLRSLTQGCAARQRRRQVWRHMIIC